MGFLSESGYTAVRLSQALDILMHHRSDIVKPVVITFDDGYHDFYTLAVPILARYGFSANMFLPTGYISDCCKSFDGTERLTWQTINELAAADIEFGSHTVTHPELKTLGFRDIEQELRRSKETIEDKLGRQVTSFSYPFAFPETLQPFVDRFRDTLIRCDYRVGVSTIIGTASPTDDCFFLRRLPVNSCDDRALFAAKLEGGYDWLHGLQRLKKRFDTHPLGSFHDPTV
jgi:peptidoglycan/xylan/chitin deacetylase (PgdA/CDA1 family)